LQALGFIPGLAKIIDYIALYILRGKPGVLCVEN